MKFTEFASLLVLAVTALADTVTYDQRYDSPSTSLDALACSNGHHGLELLGYKDIGSLPNFPFIGGAGAVAGYDSVNCGTCWQLTYVGTGKSVTVVAVDHAAPGTFNITFAAMNKLTNGQAVKVGRVDVTAKQVAKSVCGL